MELTYKEFFEKSKKSSLLQRLVMQCFNSAVKVSSSSKRIFPERPIYDSGELMLNGISIMVGLEGITLTNSDDITAEYVAGIITSYKNKP